ncbi:hypothetical protein A2230_08860 [candidate division WOR-1 bacterium RIFOXYA2_FULL_36_21]|uniref:HTH cro/C1-type domain-containing protein n=1 Tax=candidate division WOR-1 bacterium RIFOXYB2_FULL_36_35 TaxID=1802578 RepID=A0A1F4S3H8_UNCSA|nr:MAG: hypothetical protein A2230_08860 [candidate division WOR-1 bacterium RIFOXYA2_FULL_36_21]OGC14986.1 MAG: hypothetical protein A2290_01500 [candidate division WOR-1 bacterium RIFOXYB2_FULL_36_35]OGC18693.1 MAG: hypothetical protein A2282_07280 [candidate division WOR-1 bacterium RIFOXYA12_FULL_36_13]
MLGAVSLVPSSATFKKPVFLDRAMRFAVGLWILGKGPLLNEDMVLFADKKGRLFLSEHELSMSDFQLAERSRHRIVEKFLIPGVEPGALCRVSFSEELEFYKGDYRKNYLVDVDVKGKKETYYLCWREWNFGYAQKASYVVKNPDVLTSKQLDFFSDIKRREFGLSGYLRGPFPLDFEKETFLLMLAKAGNKEARDLLVYFYRRLIKRIANGNPDSDDLMQELSYKHFPRSIDKFNPELGVLFSGYVAERLNLIAFRLVNRGDKTRTGKISYEPGWRREERVRVGNIITRLEKELGYKPEEREIELALAEVVDIDSLPKRLIKSLEREKGKKLSDSERKVAGGEWLLSRYKKIGEERFSVELSLDSKGMSPLKLKNISLWGVSSYGLTQEGSIDEIVREGVTLSPLTFAERDILTRLYLYDEPMSREKIGVELKITGERVGQIEVRALSKMAYYLSQKYPEFFSVRNWELNGRRAKRYLPQTSLVGCLIKQKRKSLGMSQTELAEKLGISRSYVRGLENGENNIKGLDEGIALTLSLFLGVKDIFEGRIFSLRS